MASALFGVSSGCESIADAGGCSPDSATCRTKDLLDAPPGLSLRCQFSLECHKLHLQFPENVVQLPPGLDVNVKHVTPTHAAREFSLFEVSGSDCEKGSPRQKRTSKLTEDSPGLDSHGLSSTDDGASEFSCSGSSHTDLDCPIALHTAATSEADANMPMKVFLSCSSSATVGSPLFGMGGCVDATTFGCTDDGPTSEFTTVMLRNVPHRCTRNMLVERLNDGFRGAFDFVYMPMDFHKHCNMGYATINFKSPVTCKRFRKTFNGLQNSVGLSARNNAKVFEVTYTRVQGLEENVTAYSVGLSARNNAKVFEVTYTRVQGLEENVYSLQNSSVMEHLTVETFAEGDEWEPVLFDDLGEAVPFPRQKIAMCYHKPSTQDNRPSDCILYDGEPRECHPPAHVFPFPEFAAAGASQYPYMQPYNMPPLSMPPYGMPTLGMSHWDMPLPSMMAAQPVQTPIPDMSSWDSVCSSPSGNVVTTVMLRNLPSNCARDQLLELLNLEFTGTFDFLYMPMDFKNQCNMGYAFINFKNIAFCQRFVTVFHGIETALCFPDGSEKVLHVTPARVQGLEANIHRLRVSNIGDQLAEHPEWQPLAFDESGAPCAFLWSEHRYSHTLSPSSLPSETSASAPQPMSVAGNQVEVSSASAKPKPNFETSRKTKDTKKIPQVGSTVMLRNIPNNYTRSMLLQKLNRSFRGAFDFLYLPMDFESSCNMGYAFINFRNVDDCQSFTTEFDGVECRVCLPGFSSAKVCRVTHARVQGLDGNVRHLRSSTIMRDLAKYPEWQPLMVSSVECACLASAVPRCAESPMPAFRDWRGTSDIYGVPRSCEILPNTQNGNLSSSPRVVNPCHCQGSCPFRFQAARRSLERAVRDMNTDSLRGVVSEVLRPLPGI
eukprot:CAMPEP_0194550332 /NCGR_PEP_ID=MMETSP0253-20130528/95654_1 /TAXON_ID=2966 /ORGANISM="Noctiluca scintillans" /LENGTH=887 /DNA_ID=CAMNT_0039397771 /DNA_START=61 /DNA_END=2725 /DNA_ORIENTATION=-